MVPLGRIRSLETIGQRHEGDLRVSLPRFFSRINDAVGPLLTSGTDLRALLENKMVCLAAPEQLEAYPIHLAGFVLATNLCARLYPRLRLLASKGVTEQCASVALQINPSCEVETSRGPSDAELAWQTSPQSEGAVTIAPREWDVLVDVTGPHEIKPTNILTSLAAGAFGAGELFRTVFAQHLMSGRVRPSPGSFNILAIEGTESQLPDLPAGIDIGQVHLIGVGAIGQGAVYALARAGARGRLVVVDAEKITLSNLQRYALTTDGDVGMSKCSVIERALKESSIEVTCSEAAWGDDPKA